MDGRNVDPSVTMSLERLIAYGLMLIAFGSAYAKIQSDINFMNQRMARMEAKWDKYFEDTPRIRVQSGSSTAP